MKTARHGAPLARKRRAAALVLAGIAWAASACADPPFTPASAYDERFTTPASIIGFPDTFTAVGDSVQLTLVTDEQYRNVPRRWFVRRVDTEPCPDPCGLLQVNERTGMLVATPTSYPSRWEIGAQMGAQLYRDTVSMRQIPTGFRMLCNPACESNAHDAPIEYSVHDAELLDANGVPLFYQTDTAKRAGATLTVRDPSIVHDVNGQFRSRFTDGTTWIVRQQYGRADSVRWTVQQRFWSVRLTCPATAARSDTVWVGVSLRDIGGAPMTTPVTFTWTVVRLGQHLELPVAQDGSFVPTQAGDWFVHLFAEHATGAFDDSCVVSVP